MSTYRYDDQGRRMQSTVKGQASACVFLLGMALMSLCLSLGCQYQGMQPTGSTVGDRIPEVPRL